MWVYNAPPAEDPRGPRPALKEVFVRPKKYHYNDRDLAVLTNLLLRRFMRTDQIWREHFWYASERMARDRLQKLYERHFVNRRRLPPAGGQGSGPYVWWLDWLGWELLRHRDEDRRLRGESCLGIGRGWRPPETLPSLGNVVHDLELGDFCMDLRDHFTGQGYDVTWLTTRQAHQMVPAERAGEPAAAFNPDAVLVTRTDDAVVVLHIEYERSAELHKFKRKLAVWERYRRLGLWQGRYPAEPKVIVAGARLARPDRGRQSIEPLRAYVRAKRVSGVFFLYLDEGYWEHRPEAPFGWIVEAGATGERSPIAAPVETTLWDQVAGRIYLK